MLTWQDCVGLSDLTEEEIEAIASHEHCPDMIAAELGHYLLETPDGQLRLKAIIRDDIANAVAKGDIQRAARLKQVLRHFIESQSAQAPPAA